MKTLYITLVLLVGGYTLFAQETTKPTEEPKPKEQPLDKPTEVKETPKEQEPKVYPATNLVAGGTPAGQSPSNTQDGTFINRFQDIPVNLFMGIPIIGFPIYTLSEPGGASEPISLSYNASGMKGHDVASWVGMNWSTTMGGQISRIVRGIPDEGKFSLENNFTLTARKGFYQYGLKADNSEENDGQPDLFFLNVNGASYKFSFDTNRKAHFYPEADIDVSVNWIPRNGTAVGNFSNWIVTMPDGTKYFFSGSGYESSFELEANEATQISNGNAEIYLYAEEVVSAFYMTKIETAFGHQTLFDYHNTFYSFFRVADQEATTNNCTFTGISKRINRVYVVSSALYKISNSTMVVEFNKGGWTRGVDLYARQRWYLNNTYPARQDIDIFDKNIENESTARALHKISVYAKDDPTKLFEWKFNYDYSYGIDYNLLGYSYGNVGYTHQRRLRLRSIEEPDGNKYAFKYFDDGVPLPSRLTQGIDHWGYLNGVLGATTMIGEDAFRTCANGQYGNRTASSGWSQYGTLTAISHSTGGTTILEYENHKARNYTPIIGGSRIKKITYIDSISNLKTTKRYDYQQVNGQSSGLLCLKPVYHFDDKINYSGARDQYWHSGLYQQLLSENGRPAVGYSRVKETILTGTETDSLGYTISDFLQPLTEINIRETVTSNCVTQYPPTVPYPVTTCDTNRYLRPWRWNPYHENTVGVASRVAVYGKMNQLLSEKSNVYEEYQLQGTATPYQQNYHAFRLVGQNYNFSANYIEFYNTFRLMSDTTKVFSQNGTNPVVTITNYQYQNLGRHNQVIKTITTDSFRNIIEVFVKYAADFNFSLLPPTNLEAKGIYQLKQKHIINGVIESITRKKSFFGNTFVVSASYQSYYDKDSATFQAGLPKLSYVLENVPRATFNEVSYDSNTDTFTKSTDYDLKSTAEGYTAIGLPKQANTRFGTQSKIIYHPTYPTLAISQISNVGLVSEQTTTTEYAKILYGISKQTGINGLSVTNEYYPDGKLKQQTDKDGKVLKHIQYVYRGQADNDPILTTNVGYNRIITRIPRIATTTPLTLTHVDCAISVLYMDGAGRIVENVGYRASPNEKDIITGVTEYDQFNRPQKQWLSVESTQATGALLDTATVKAIAKTFYQDQKPYSEILEYEASPMSRVFKSYGVGKVWQDSSKYVQNSYETGMGIKRFMMSYTDNLALIGSYLDYELSKMTSIDERGNKVIEYKDKAGNTVQRDVQIGTTTYLSNCYVFDDAGRLRYILPPKAYNALGNTTAIDFEAWTEFNENVYATHYDGRGRVYESHKPGIGWSRAVYNRLNQTCLSQDDDELAKNNTWNYVQTDGQGRSIRTGQMQLPSNFTRQYLQNLFDNFTDSQQFEERSTASGNIQQYTNRSFPAALRAYITDVSWKTHTYYDDYTWTKKSNWDNTSTEADYDFQVHPFSAVRYLNSKGLATGAKIKHEIWGDINWFGSVNYYDDKNRVIENITTNHLLKRNQSDFQFNFIGEILRDRSLHRKDGVPDQTITHRMIYDYVGRTKEMYYTLVQGTIKKIDSLKMISNSFDAIGRIKIKFVQPNSNVVSSIKSGYWTPTNTQLWHNGILPTLTTPVAINSGHTITIPPYNTMQVGTLYNAGKLEVQVGGRLQLGTLSAVKGAALQVIEYFYNIRGQIRGVNLDANENPQVSQDKLFSYKIDYHEDGRYFDGSISKQTWKSMPLTPSGATMARSYTYTYDRANKLTNAQYVGIGNENYSVLNSYDANGNILTLQRYGKTGASSFGLVDNLVYGYINNGNKLQKIDDGVTGNIPANDFRDVSGNDYAYSADGKMTKDGNKNIVSIRYNYLDLVSSMRFVNGDSVAYWYSSTGSRIQRKVTKAGQPDNYTIYDGEMVYNYTGASPSLAGFNIAEIQNSEGRYVNGKLEYGYTDHVGNLRLSYKDSLGVAFVTQSQSYDPWSNVNAGSEYQLSGNQSDRYLVSGKETDNLSGNILLDWRDYDSVTGRMNSYDPEDQSMSMSGYAYCGNNPVMMVDPDGRFAFVPFLMTALFTGHISGMISQSSGGSYGKGFATGAATSVIGGAVGSGMSAILGQAGTFGGAFLRGALGGAVSGGISGGVGSLMNGGSFGDGFTGGSLSGGISGGIMAGIGHLKMQLKLNRVMTSLKESGVINDSDELPFDEDFLNKFSDANGFNKESANVGRLTTADNFRSQRGFIYDPESGALVGNGVAADAVTFYYGQGSKSDIYVGKSAFISAKRLFVVVGHEFVHANHYAQGLFEKMINLHGVAEGNRQFIIHSEAGAYSYSLAASKNIGETGSYISHIRRLFIEHFPNDMTKSWGWRKYGMPLTQKFTK